MSAMPSASKPFSRSTVITLPLMCTERDPAPGEDPAGQLVGGPVVVDDLAGDVAVVAHPRQGPVGLEPDDARSGRRPLDDVDDLTHDGAEGTWTDPMATGSRRGRGSHRRFADPPEDPRPHRRRRRPSTGSTPSTSGAPTFDPSRVVLELSHPDEAGDRRPVRAARGPRRQPGQPRRRRLRSTPTETACCPPASTPPPTLATDVRIDGHWIPVANPEMDCGLSSADACIDVRTVPMHQIRTGDRVVVGPRRCPGPPARARPRHRAFEFTNSDVSSEKPKALLVRQVADRIRAARDRQWAHPRRRRPSRDPHRWRPGRGPPGRRPAGSTSCSPATASPPTTWSRTCWARRSACRSPRATAPRAATPTTSGSSTRSAGTGRSRAAVEAGFVTGGVMYRVRAAGRAVRAGRFGARRRAAARHHRRRRGGRRHHGLRQPLPASPSA